MQIIAALSLLGLGFGFRVARRAKRSIDYSTIFDAENATQKRNCNARGDTVAVIGAGLAGLVAATELQDEGAAVTVLEAKSFVGGRAITHVTPEGVPLDLGASFVLDWTRMGSDSPLRRFARRFGARLDPGDGNFSYPGQGGEWSKDAIKDADYDEWLGLAYAEIAKASNSQSSDSMADVLRTVEGKLGRRLSAGQLEWLSKSLFETDLTGDLDDMWAGAGWEGSSYGSDQRMIQQGVSLISENLAKEVRDLKLQHEVTRISLSSRRRVRVDVQTRSHGTLTFDRVVLTVPVGVLKNSGIQFSPSLPRSHTRALGMLGMGTLSKTWLVFRDFWWKDTSKVRSSLSAFSFGHIGDRNKMFYWFAPSSIHPVLMGFMSGPEGRAMEARSDAQVERMAMDSLSDMFGNVVPNPVRVHQTRWGRDKFSYGAYGYLRAARRRSARRDLGALVRDNGWRGKLFIAGEATSQRYPCSMDGAIESGTNVRQQVCSN